MSAICHGFVQNAWRKDICSNCFRMRDEHSKTEISNSVTSSTTGTSCNGVNVHISSIVSATGKKSGFEANADKTSPALKVNRFQGSNPNLNGMSTSSGTLGQGSSGIPRITNNSSNNCNSSQGTKSFANTASNVTFSHTSSTKHNEFNDNQPVTPLSETNVKVKSTEGTITKTTLSLSTSNQQIQGKGVMTNQHPSKSDNANVISNHNNNKQQSSSAVLQVTGRNSSVPSTSSSSFIASKNIFNVAQPTPASATGSTSVNVYGSSATSTASASTTVSSASALGSSFSHFQSATSIKRGNINVSQSSSCVHSSQENQKGSSEVVESGGAGWGTKNVENFTKNGVIDRELSDGVSNTNICSSGGVSGGVMLSVSKDGISQDGMSKGVRVGKQMDVTDGEVGRRKVGFTSGASVIPSGSGGGDSNVSKVSNAMKANTIHGSKGILRKNGNKKRDKNVRFPDEVVRVIGYGGPSGVSDDEDDSPPDPLDSASVAEVMEKSSTTMEEKELHRITQKNTNFNSIKTNLLGTTCIEIGPIVGCTGGKSMEGSSKPLVSIGTFETRKEPLRIHKKISEDSADDELNEKTVERHRKFIPRSTNSTTNVSTIGKSTASQAPSKIASISTYYSSTGSKEDTKQQTSVSSASSTVNTVSSSKTSSSTFNTTTLTSKTSVTNTQTSSSSSNKSATLSFDKGNGSSTFSATTIEVNPEQTSSSCKNTTNAIKSSKETIANVSTTERRSKSSINQGTSTVNRIISSSNSGTSSTTTTSTKWNNSNLSSACGTDGVLSSKPVLKRIQQHQQKAESTETFTVNTALVETNGVKKSASSMGVSSTTASLNSKNNLIILTKADKKVNNATASSIASKRSSFLRDIIVDSSSTTKSEAEGNELAPSGSATAAVQVICKNNESSLMKTELKVDLKPSVNNGKLSHPPFGECLSNRSNGTDDSSEFDDSLEDSGLDIKKCSEISESDEKSGSGSDSGNENDYSDRDRVKLVSATGPKSGLFISVEEVEGTNKKPEKLSPDSVLFSSASEMSASGSSESIPEALDTISNGSSQKAPSSSGESNNASTVKRAAPRPPNPTKEMTQENAIYANSQSQSVEVEGIYDDVSFYKNPMHFPAKAENMAAFEEEEDDENIYDDCTATLTAMPKGGIKSGAKSAMGSYNFQNGSHNALDSDGEEETEKVVTRRSDGIEFIGIRKIDSESFLRERSPSPQKNPDGNGKRERSSSASPKTRRKVNQFFSTIGKKAGAAFSQHVHGYGKNKGHTAIEDSVIEKSPSTNSSAYKRSQSTDEVSVTRTQEIYATLTPTSLKFKGLAPVLHKLSKMDLNLGDKDKNGGDDDDKDLKDKGYKKHKISTSIKKFLRFGSKDGGESSGNKYDFGNCPNKTESGNMITSQISEESIDSSSSRTPTPTAGGILVKIPDRKTSYGTIAGRPPPPPPPRTHSLDLLTRVGPNGTVRPARPPPPTRHNRVAPSFTSVFTNPNAVTESKTNDEQSSPTQGNRNDHSSEDIPDPNNPPSKPKRKASINLECVTNGASRDLQTTYNHITTLNLETLKLIASQAPTKIRRSIKVGRRSSSNSLRWSHFHIPEPLRPLVQGPGFVFHLALLDDEPCVLLVQESATAPNFSAPFEFPCVETSATFEDFIPGSFITWQASEYVTNGSNVKVFVSVMPKYNMYTVENYMRHSQVPLLHKYFALLQAMNYWDQEHMSDLLVLVQSMEEPDNHFASTMARGSSDISQQPISPSSVLVYVHPIPHIPSGPKAPAKRSSSKTHLSVDFESSMKQILLSNGSDGSTPLLGENDRQVLLKRLNEKSRTDQDQIRLFLQVKLFAPKRDSDEFERMKKLKSERTIQQWLDRERAMCMKEAVEQTLQRNIESSISPYKRSYLEFLLTPENSAKAVLDMLIDLLE